VPSSITIQGAGQALKCATRGMVKPQDGPGRLTAALVSRKQLAATLTAAERDGAHVLSMGSAPGYFTDRQEWIATWEHWLGAAADASKQQCSHCSARELTMIPGITGGGTWWCGACSHATTPVVNRMEYEALPCPTVGIGPPMPDSGMIF
jgi:hypothetical protein